VRGEVIPLRPLTLSEILDAGVELLRRNATRLLITSAGLSLVEGLLLYPLQDLAGVSAPWYLPHLARLSQYWLLFAAGFGTELAIIAILGGLAARAALPALGVTVAPGPLRGRRPTAPKAAPHRRRVGGMAVLAAVVGLAGTLTAAAGFLPWIVWYAFTGLAAPVLIIEGRGPLAALGRSFALVGRGGLRPGAIRVVGYLAWWAIRLALAAGGVAALQLTGQVSSRFALALAGLVAWVVVNTVSYAVLGCLDTVLHLENRMRVEGLDLALSRALRRGIPAEQILVGQR
jgi:hypothetical protein